MGLQIGSALIALIASSAIPPAAIAAPLQPGGAWALDYGATQCTAARTYATASGPVVLGIVPSLSGNSYRLIVNVPRAGPSFARELAGSVDSGQRKLATPLLYYGSPGVAQSAYEARIPFTQLQQAGASGLVTLNVTDGDSYSFAVPDMPALLDSLAKCTADLQQYWNLNAPTITTAAAPANGDIAAFITRSDYPTEATRRQEMRGKVQYQVMVDEKGAVAGCDVLASSGIPTVDTTGCDVIKQQARFTPARSSSGQAVRSTVTTPLVVWESRRSDVFDTGCSMVSGNTNEVVSMCGREDPRVLEAPVSTRPSPLPRTPRG